MPNKVFGIFFIKRPLLMSKVNAVHKERVETLAELISAIDTYGTENVTIRSVGDLNAVFNSDSTINDLYNILLPKLNDFSAKELFSNIISTNTIITRHKDVLGISKNKLLDNLFYMIIERRIMIHNLPNNTSLKHLNLLADHELVNLYNIENIKSIDLEFVQKYGNKMDLKRLNRCTNKPEVLEYSSVLGTSLESEGTK
ncbi:hypothetical protein [Yersinia phage fHe-Yen9-04]|uniref:Uncharacterized protein n=1 Tax=Yersinia phage fHe-Yen9-04 TaxID=2052742 RepID=A0A2C9CY48_9CAUD|nr:hypothetical protein FDJ41_gp397 [Yersinia phage fHe-Yen9-04]SOK58783.1 hypothetical protein [Yersinia phage fHe-Yen9-04]VUE36552.1 hypothetical protein [Yersinia phage fHe-Yen9-04]